MAKKMNDKLAKKSGGRSAKAKSSAPSAKHMSGEWKLKTLEQIRKLILDAVPDAVEEVKWRKPSNNMAGVPVWSSHGIICTGETYAKVVKLTFAQGAKLSDPSGLFNASLEGNTRRAIDIHEGEKIDANAFKTLVRQAAARNAESKAVPKTKRAKSKPATEKKPVKLLSGGNPQIAKGEGDEPVQAYIAAMPGWKSDVGRRLDALIARAVPTVRKAVKWNSPFYGIEGQGWFLGFHVFNKYIKIAFIFGASLRPMPPVESKDKNARYLHIYEDEKIDEAQFIDWVKQAAALPGWNPGKPT